MKKNIAIFIAFAFMAMQLLSFQHMASYGFKEHKHAGHICEVSIYFQKSQSFDSAAKAPLVIGEQNYISVSQIITAENAVLSFFAFTQSPRAPPGILQA